MSRAAIYARFSTNLQSDRSIEDQITLCKAYAIQNGLTVVEIYYDAAKSGASMHNREGILQLMSDAMNGKFDVVVVEALDRLSRDMEDLAGIAKRLQFMGIELVGVHDGKANTVTVGLRGLVGQLFREDNAHKVRRGLMGRVKQGLSGGGQAYGYRPDPMNKGKQLIYEPEAEIVRRIFEEYASGKLPRQIAYALNNEGVPPPRGEKWNASTINGSAKRNNGILHNPLYAGVRVWNRVKMIKDPYTGRRVSRPNPESEWERAEVPELRIVSDELWEIAQGKRLARKPVEELHTMRRPKRLFSGLLKCGACGSGMSTMGKDKSGRVRIRCTRQHESGDCPDPRTYYLDKVEDVVVNKLVSLMVDPDLLREYVDAYQQELRRMSRVRERRRDKLGQELQKIEKQVKSIVMKLIDEIIGDAEATALLNPLRARKAEIEQELAALPEEENVVELHPQAVLNAQEAIRGLQCALAEGRVDPTSQEADFLRQMITQIILEPTAAEGQIVVEIQGHLTALLSREKLAKAVGGIGGSGGGTRTPDTRIMI